LDEGKNSSCNYELVVPNKQDHFMSGRSTWLSSKNINLWYRDASRSMSLQNKVVHNLISSTNSIISEVVRTTGQYKEIQEWCNNYLSSLNVIDLMKVTLRDNAKGMDNVVDCWPSLKDPEIPNILNSKLCNITKVLEAVDTSGVTDKLKNQVDCLNTSRLQLASMIYEYDNRFNFSPETDTTDIDIETFRRLDNHDISGNNLQEREYEVNKYNVVGKTDMVTGDSGEIIWVDSNGNTKSQGELSSFEGFTPLNKPGTNEFKPVPVRIVRTSHPPGLEHRLDEVESILDNKLSNLPGLEDRLTGIEGMVEDYQNMKEFLTNEINNLRNSNIDDTVDNTAQLQEIRNYITRELTNNKQMKDENMDTNLNSINNRLTELEINTEQRLNDMMDINHQETIQLQNTFNQQISQLDLSNNNILGEMKSIKDSVITTSNEINTMKEEINTAGQKIKKVLKKGNIQ
jgi:uncharacterized coiled-coil protein SlyX